MNKIKHKLILAFIATTLIISVLYGFLVFNAMKYTEDDILTRRIYLEFDAYIQNRQLGGSTALLPTAPGLNSYLSTSPDLPIWLKDQPLGERELHDKEVHVGVFELLDTGERLYLVLSEEESSNLENEFIPLIVILTMFGVVITFIGLLIGLFFSKQIARPIQLLTQDVELDNFKKQNVFFGNQRHDEIGALSRAFGSLVLRLESFVTREKKFTKYVSHEFRTPISLLKNALAVLKLPDQTESRRERNLLRIESATLEMENLINTFLSLSREDMELEKQSINIVALLNDNLQRNESTYNNKRLHIKVEINNELTVNSDKNILTILIDNVIRNIFIHGDTEANITVCENSLIFENNFKALPNSIEHKKETQGLQIIKQLAEKINVDISTSLTDQQFDLNIFFRPEHKGHCPKRD